MKNRKGWENNGNGNNRSGFSGLPGGYVNSMGHFSDLGLGGYWWSASKNNKDNVTHRHLSANDEYLSRFQSTKTAGFYVRCLKD